MSTLAAAWTGARKRLEAAGIDSPAIDARLLLEVAASVSRTDIVTDPYRELTPEQEAAFDSFLERRARREPVSHIVGRKGFWKIMLGVNAHVLTPRPDTEVIVDLVLAAFPEHRQFNLLDCGVGGWAARRSVRRHCPRDPGRAAAGKGVGGRCV